MILWSYAFDHTPDHLIDLTYDYRGNLLLDQLLVRKIQHLPTGQTALTVAGRTIYVLTSNYQNVLSTNYAEG